MKTNKIYLILGCFIVVSSFISCGVNRTAGCDAYGQEIVIEKTQDLASK